MVDDRLGTGIDNRNDVEPDFEGNIVYPYISLGGGDNLFYFLFRHGVLRVFVQNVIPGFDFRNNQQAVLLRYDIQFQPAAFPVSFTNRVSCRNQVFDGQLLPFFPGRVVYSHTRGLSYCHQSGAEAVFPERSVLEIGIFVFGTQFVDNSVS